MIQKRVFFVVALFFCGFNTAFAQFSLGFGLESGLVKTKEIYTYQLRDYNDNETFSYYDVRSELGIIAPGFMIRSFGAQFSKAKKITMGYSLEVGFRSFSSNSHLIFRGSSSSNSDSIINKFGGFEFRTRYHIVRMNHYFDLHWNPTEKIKITNSFGIGLAAIVKHASPKADINGTIVNTNHPIVRFLYQPQITEKYERFSLTFFTSIDLFSFALFTKPSPFENPDYRIPFQKLRFNSVGIRLIPHPKQKSIDLPLEY